MAKKNKEYWQKRAEFRLVESEVIGKKTIAQTSQIYDEALRKIEADIKSIYENYATNGIVDVSLLKKALNPLEKQNFLNNVNKNMLRLGLNPNEVFDERYLGRLTRLDALKKQIEVEVMAMAPNQERVFDKNFTELIQNGYSNAQADLKVMGATPGFATLDKTVTKAILKAEWYEGNYSSRIWDNTGDLAKALPNIMASGLSTGQSYEKTARILREKFNVTRYESTRLVVTETNFFHNQSELQSYIDDGIERYEYLATLDKRTSKFCRDHDGHEYLIKDAVVGVNYPPGHPWCRSTTTPLFDGETARKPTKAERIERLNPFDDESVKDNWRKQISV